MPVSFAFRILLLIVIIIAFFTLLPIIKNLKLNAKAAETEQVTGEEDKNTKEEGKGNKEQVAEGNKPKIEKPAPPAVKPKDQPEKKPPPEKPAAPAQPSKAPEQKEPEKKPQPEKPAAPVQPSTTPVQPPAQPSSPQPVKPAETRGNIYLIQESNKMLVKVNRNLNPNTPLRDSINALLAGPTPDEIMRGIESFVPEGSRLLSAKREGSTAVLDFNQEFRYNTRGREGCEAQIKQIVWTATEIPGVQNVQFLIDGKKVDFLSEGVVISSPIGR